MTQVVNDQQRLINNDRQPKTADKMFMIPKAYDGTKPAEAKHTWDQFKKYTELQAANGSINTFAEQKNMFKMLMVGIANIWFQETGTLAVDLDDLGEKFLTRFNKHGRTHKQQIKSWNKLTYTPGSEEIEKFAEEVKFLGKLLQMTDEQILVKFKESMPNNIEAQLININTWDDTFKLAKSLSNIYQPESAQTASAGTVLAHLQQVKTTDGDDIKPNHNQRKPQFPKQDTHSTENSNMQNTPQNQSSSAPQRGRGNDNNRRPRGRGNYRNNYRGRGNFGGNNWQDQNNWQKDNSWNNQENPRGGFRGRFNNYRGQNNYRGNNFRGNRGQNNFRGRFRGGRNNYRGRGRGNYGQYQNAQQGYDQSYYQYEHEDENQAPIHICKICEGRDHLEKDCLMGKHQVLDLHQKMGLTLGDNENL